MLLCVVAAVWLGWQLIDPGETTAADDDPSTTPTASAPATTEPPSAPTPTPTPTATETIDSSVDRSTPVSVLNNTSVANLAAQYKTEVEAAGWTVGGVGNWRGQIPSNTVYYPAGLETQARQLGEDLGIERVLPRTDAMRPDRLTIILSGPQQ